MFFTASRSGNKGRETFLRFVASHEHFLKQVVLLGGKTYAILGNFETDSVHVAELRDFFALGGNLGRILVVVDVVVVRIGAGRVWNSLGERVKLLHAIRSGK